MALNVSVSGGSACREVVLFPGLWGHGSSCCWAGGWWGEGWCGRQECSWWRERCCAGCARRESQAGCQRVAEQRKAEISHGRCTLHFRQLQEAAGEANHEPHEQPCGAALPGALTPSAAPYSCLPLLCCLDAPSAFHAFGCCVRCHNSSWCLLAIAEGCSHSGSFLIAVLLWSQLAKYSSLLWKQWQSDLERKSVRFCRNLQLIEW